MNDAGPTIIIAQQPRGVWENIIPRHSLPAKMVKGLLYFFQEEVHFLGEGAGRLLEGLFREWGRC